MRTLLLSLLISSSAFAADKIIETSVPANFSPIEAFGLEIANGKIAIASGKLENRSNKNSIPVSLSTSEGASLVASILKDESGNYITSELTTPVVSKSKAACTSTIDDHNLASAQPAILQALVQVRAEKRELYKEKVTKLLEGDFLSTLRRLESGFGLGGSVPISPEMSPYELSERISALAVVLGNLESQKK